MPYKPKHPCRVQGCPNLVPTGQSYCPAHKRQADQEYNQHRPAHHAFYASYGWTKVRQRALEVYGARCQTCGTPEGRMIVDHIIPIVHRPDLSLDLSNVQILCQGCHNRKTRRDAKNG